MDGERVVVTVAKMDEQVWHELEDSRNKVTIKYRRRAVERAEFADQTVNSLARFPFEYHCLQN